MGWLYKGKILEDSEIPLKSQGFIYCITHVSGKKYLGRKLLTKAHRRQKNKKIIKTRIESDWRDYWSSSPDFISHVENEGKDKFTREILMFLETKGQLNYMEERLLYTVGALESENWYNSNIRSKMYKKNILDKINLDDIQYCIQKLQEDKK